MKNKKLLTASMIAGLALGGLSAGAVASAQGYGGEQDTGTEIVVEADTSRLDEVVLVQDTNEPETNETDGERQGRRGHGRGCNLEDAAAAIGIDEADLKAALDDGNTIAEVAQANGVDVHTVIGDMVDAKAEHLADKVAEGRITQAEADAKLTETEGRTTARVNGTNDNPGS